MKFWISAILTVGLIRFILAVSGFPDSVVKYASMTVVIIAASFYFAIACATRRDRLKAAYLLILPYMVVEVTALSYTWASGRHTIFHAPQYALGTDIATHTLGHLIGGLTWEPLIVFVMMEIIRAVYQQSRGLLGFRSE